MNPGAWSFNKPTQNTRKEIAKVKGGGGERIKFTQEKIKLNSVSTLPQKNPEKNHLSQ